MAVSGSGGYGGPNFAQIENSLRNIALQFGSILSLTQQLQASIQTFRNFERELTLANFAAGGTSATFNQMETAARNMALGSVNSVGQLANAFGNLARAGLDAKEVLSAATGVMLLANATMTDLGEAADTTASTMAQFNLRADESNRIANLFVAASNNSLASMNKLSFAMRQVGPIASQANLSLEQTVGMLDKLFDAGLRGEQAGTALRNTIARLINPVGEGATILENVGVSAINGKGQIDIDAALRKMAELRLSVEDINKIVGVEAAAGVLTLMQAYRTTGDTLDDHIKKISGTTDAYRQAIASMSTLDGSLTQAGNAFNELRIIAGENMAPLLITLSQNFVDLVLALRETEFGTAATVIQFALAAAGIGVFLKGIHGIAPAFTSTRKAIDSFQDGVTAGRNAMAAFGAGASTTGVGLRAASNSMRSFTTAAMGFAGVAAGALGVVAAIGAVTYAIIEMDKAKRRAKIEEITGDLGMNADQARRNLRNTVLQTNVDTETGAGAVERYTALRENMRGAEDERKRLEKEIQDYAGRDAEIQRMYQRQAEAMRESASGMALAVSYASDGSDTDKQRLKEATIRLARAPANNWKAAVEAYRQELITGIRSNETISNAAKAQAIEAANRQADGLMQITGAMRTVTQSRLIAAANQASFGADEQRTRDTFYDILSDTSADFLNGKDIEALLTELGQNAAQYGEVAERARSEMAEIEGALKLQTVNFIKAYYTAAGVNGDYAAEQTSRFIDNNPERYLEIIRKNGNDVVGQMNDLFAELRKQGIRIAEAAQAPDLRGNTPTINTKAIAEYAASVYGDLYRQAGEAATAGMRGRAISTQQRVDMFEFNERAIEQLSRSAGTTNKDAVTAAVNGLVASNGRTSTETIVQALRQGGVVVGENNIRAITETVDIVRDDYRKSMNSAADRYKPAASSRRADRSNARAIEKLLDLPTPQEFQLERQEVALRAQYILNEFFNLPIDAYRQSLDEERLNFSGKLQDLQRDFEKFYRDSIAKDTTAATNRNLVSAFAGRGFAYQGKQFSAEMLESAETAKQYTDAALEAFQAALPKGSSQYNERIANARRVLAELPVQTAGAFREFNQNMRLLDLEQAEMRRNAEEFARDFDAEAVIRRFEQALAAFRSGPQSLEVAIDLAVKAKVSRVELDANEAIRALNEQYKQRFADLGVQMNLDANGRFVAYEPPTAPQVAGLMATQPQTVNAILDYARSYVGQTERGDTGSLRELFQQANTNIDPRMVAWCAAFVNSVLAANGIEGSGSNMARSLLNVGEETKDPRAGDIVVLRRGRGNTYGHTGFLEGFDDNGNPRVLGGNQGRNGAVSVQSFNKRDVLGYRRIPGMEEGMGVVPAPTPQQQQINAWRMAGFADEESFQAYVQELQARQAEEVANIQRAAEERKAFFALPENEIVSQVEVIEQLTTRWGELEGSVVNARVAISQIASDMAEARLEAVQFLAGTDMRLATESVSDNVTAWQALKDAVLEARRAEIAVERDRQIADIREKAMRADAAGNRDALREAAQLEDEVTRAAQRRIDALVSSTEVQRTTTELYIESLRQASEMNGGLGDSVFDLIRGAQAGLAQLAADIPTNFEIAMSSTTQLLDGMAGAVGTLFSEWSAGADGWGENFRKAASSVLQSVASMIAQMLIMAATLQLIRMIPGGEAVLRFMDGASSIGRAAPTATGGGGDSGGLLPGRLNYAQGGIHDHQQMFNGGVKRPGQTSMAIFGEGQWPEAFVPMVDGATIPVQMGQDGRYYVPLPSGQRVPVSMKGATKRHAFGGISGNVIPTNRMAADQVSAPMSEATGYAGGGMRTSQLSGGGGNTYVFQGGAITVNGNVDEGFAPKLAEEQARQFSGLLQAHEAENTRNRLKRESRTGYSPRGTI